MARRKNPPESTRAKNALSDRLRTVRAELYGDRGGPEVARRLALPIRTWYNYESGVTVPAEVVLKFMELTSAEPMWLLHGRGPKFRAYPPPGEVPMTERGAVISSLLRAALQHLEHLEGEGPGVGPLAPKAQEGPIVALRNLQTPGAAPLNEADGSSFEVARRAFQFAKQDQRCVRTEDQAMAPLVPSGALVAHSEVDEPAAALDGKIVVAWTNEGPVVRWLQVTRNYFLLRVENPKTEPAAQAFDFQQLPQGWRLRRALWAGLPAPH